MKIGATVSPWRYEIKGQMGVAIANSSGVANRNDIRANVIG
jgi:hypothetical protein